MITTLLNSQSSLPKTEGKRKKKAGQDVCTNKQALQHIYHHAFPTDRIE